MNHQPTLSKPIIVEAPIVSPIELTIERLPEAYRAGAQGMEARYKTV